MSCQQVPTAPALKPYPRSVQVGEFEVAISGGVWVAIRDRRQVIPPELIGKIAPTRLESINLRGVFRFPVDRYADQIRFCRNRPVLVS